MKEKVLDFLCRKVRLMDETYTVGGLLAVIFGMVVFLLLVGLAEGLG